jgi:Holliday junction resolvase RusA-like endonuclease
MSEETEKIKPLVVKVSYDHIPSVNNAYKAHGYKKYLTPEAAEFKTTIKNCLMNLQCNWSEIYPWMYWDHYLEVEVHALFNTNFEKRDIDNILKLSLDAFHEWLEIDDSYNLVVTARKFYVPSSPKEYLIIICKPCFDDYMAYHKKWIKEEDEQGKNQS